MIVMGVDPGFKGGIAVISDGEVVVAEKMPIRNTKKTGKAKQRSEVDVDRIAEIVAYFWPELAVVELVGAMPGEGVVSSFRFGEGVGMILGAIGSLGVPIIRPTPQQWKKVVLAGTAKDKEAAILRVTAKYPEVRLIPKRCRVPHDGIADSVLIAEYGMVSCGK